MAASALRAESTLSPSLCDNANSVDNAFTDCCREFDTFSNLLGKFYV